MFSGSHAHFFYTACLLLSLLTASHLPCYLISSFLWEFLWRFWCIYRLFLILYIAKSSTLNISNEGPLNFFSSLDCNYFISSTRLFTKCCVAFNALDLNVFRQGFPLFVYCLSTPAYRYLSAFSDISPSEFVHHTYFTNTNQWWVNVHS